MTSRCDSYPPHPSDDIQSAAEALESLRCSSLPPAAVTTARKSHKSHLNQPYRRPSPYQSRSLPTPAPPIQQQGLPSGYQTFLNPIVDTAVSVYEHGKSVSSSFKYSAEKIESLMTASPAAQPPPPEPQTQTQTQAQAQAQNSWLATATSLATTPFSHENKQRLRYCLHLLKLANRHIATKISQLQQLIQEEQTDGTASPSDVKKAKEAKVLLFSQTVNNIKKDIIWTLRKVVSAVSTYAGNSLPEPARSRVRNYILGLPQRWMSATATPNTQTDISAPTTLSKSTTEIRSPRQSSDSFMSETTEADSDSDNLLSPTTSNTSVSTATTAAPARAQDAEASNKVLFLANEALEMISSISGIVNDTLELAEVWYDRLNLRPAAAQEQNHQLCQEDSSSSSSSVCTGSQRGGEDSVMGKLQPSSDANTAPTTKARPLHQSFHVADADVEMQDA